MNTVGSVAVTDYLRNVATEQELVQFEQDIASRREALQGSLDSKNLCWHFFGDGKAILVGEKGLPDPAFSNVLKNWERQQR